MASTVTMAVLFQKASELGVPHIPVRSSSKPTTAQNCITQVLGANDTCGPDQAAAVKLGLPGAAALLLQLEVSIDLSLEMAREARAQGVSVMLDPGPVRPVPAELLSLCDVITPNETEAQALVRKRLVLA